MTRYQPEAAADLIHHPIITEKATLLLESNNYTFEVDSRATKPQIKAAIEELFAVKVTGVSTHTLPRKKKRMGRTVGYRTRHKRAIVTLAPGNEINLFPEV